MSETIVRSAKLSDVEALAPLLDSYRQFYEQRSDLDAAREFLRERFARNQSVIFIAEDEGRAVGFTQLYPSFSSVSLARIFILNDLFVDPDARKKGVGRALLDAAVAYAHKVGAVRLTLTTATTNKTAQSVYESAGWKRDEVFFVYHYSVR